MNIRKGLSYVFKSEKIYWDWWVINENMDRSYIPSMFQFLTLDKGKTALDVGSGNGFYAEILRDNGYDVICADRSKKR